MKPIQFFSSLLCTVSLFTACDPAENITECDIDGVICTEEFRTVEMSLTQSSGEPATLDSVVVTKDGETLFTASTDTVTTGVFPVITDAEMNDIIKEGSQVVFKGYESGAVIVNENYKVGHDCCHVVFIQGTQDVVLTSEN